MISEIEGKAARVAASEQGRERVSNSPATPKQAKAGVSKASPKKISIQMITLNTPLRSIAVKVSCETKLIITAADDGAPKRHEK